MSLLSTKQIDPALPIVYLSHSKRSLMHRCGRAYAYRYVHRLEPTTKNATLGYGKAMHAGLAFSLTSQAIADVLTDPAPIFDREWDSFCSANAVNYSQGWTQEEMSKTAHAVLSKFQADWATRGWTVVLDKEGLPVIEREFRIRLPGNIIYIAIIDALVRAADGRIIVVDFKTPLTAVADKFAYLSDQLLGYQIVLDAHADAIGIDKVDGGAFYELTKVMLPKTKSRGEGPKLHVTDVLPRRDQEAIADWIRESQFVANDIRSERFTRRTRDGFDTSCTLCDYATVCRGASDPTLQVRPRSRFSAPMTRSASLPF